MTRHPILCFLSHRRVVISSSFSLLFTFCDPRVDERNQAHFDVVAQSPLCDFELCHLIVQSHLTLDYNQVKRYIDEIRSSSIETRIRATRYPRVDERNQAGWWSTGAIQQHPFLTFCHSIVQSFNSLQSIQSGPIRSCFLSMVVGVEDTGECDRRRLVLCNRKRTGTVHLMLHIMK